MIKKMMTIPALFAALAILLSAPSGSVAENAAKTIPDAIDRRTVIAPGDYGSLILDSKTGPGKAMPTVYFPHWWHRSQFTCKVCHTEIGFPMKKGETDFVMGNIFGGQQCGACHNGSVAFAAMDCTRCHTGGVPAEANRKIEESFADLPKSDFGNKIDWVKALREEKIKPKASIDGTGEMTVVDMDIDIEVTKFDPAPPNVVYPHKAHTEWLDCSSCHPDTFKMEKGGNPDMSMRKILSGQYCGVCHDRVAFPLADCFRCHSAPPEGIERWDEDKEEEEKVEQ